MRSGVRFLFGTLVCALLTAVSVDSIRADQSGRVEPVPLGGSLSNQSGDRHFGVYIPTRYGGNLSIRASSGRVEAIAGPDGRPRTNGQEVGRDQHGWYTFKVVEAKGPYTVATTFEQVAQATRMPWNFYYWPTKGDAVHEPWAGGNGRVDTMGPVGDDVMVRSYGSYVPPGEDIILPGPNGILETPPAPGDTSTWFPNLYDDLTWRGADGTIYSTPAPMLKYDQLFGQSARRWEAANAQNQDIQRWPGHCLGGAICSIMLSEPQPAPGSGLTQDELKALWAELGENHYNHQIGANVNNIPAGPPRPGFDETDAHVARMHAMFEQHIRGQRKALLANLRGFPPTGKPNEVWNHGVGKYIAKYHAIPGRGARQVRVELTLFANSGSNLNESEPKPRTNTYEYIIQYTPAGEVDEYTPGVADFIAVGGEAMYAPLNVMEVLNSRWQGHNPMVSEANVRAVDMANGGGQGFAGAPPQFRPVASYEMGRAPMMAGGGIFGGMLGGGDGNAGYNDMNAPRRGLFRVFGR